MNGRRPAALVSLLPEDQGRPADPLGLEERLGALEADLAQIVASPSYRPIVERLTCLRGISQLSAISLLAELQDLRRFAHPGQLMAFVGLVPSERSSGGKERRGPITKTATAMPAGS